jgi:catalase
MIHLHNFKQSTIAAAFSLLMATGSIAQQTQPKQGVEPGEVVSTLESTFGVHPGARRNHTKGTCAAGFFTGLPTGAALSKSPLFSGERIPVVGRLSVAGGNPNAPDTARNARGMALEFRFADGQRQHITMLNTPIFGAANPGTFNAVIAASKPDPATGKPDQKKIAEALAAHPDALAQAAYLAKNTPPTSYANATFFSIHTFRFIDRSNAVHLIKWRFVPQDGDKHLSADALSTAPHDFLESTLLHRTAQGPVKWDMVVYQGEPGDIENDATIAWPESRAHFVAGTLTITAATPQKGASCENINFDPLVMAEGIAPTDDPVLLFRSPAYAASFAKRLTGQ